MSHSGSGSAPATFEPLVLAPSALAVARAVAATPALARHAAFEVPCPAAEARHVRKAETRWKVRFTVRTLLVGVACWASALAVWVSFVVPTRERLADRECELQLAYIGDALKCYYDIHKRFPPASLRDANGTAMHSWRALVADYFRGDGFLVRYDRAKPWNHPTNLAVTDAYAADQPVFHCPGDGGRERREMASYLMITGPGTAEPGLAEDEVDDGLASTLMVVELCDTGIYWSEPRDISIDELEQALADGRWGTPGVCHSAGPRALFMDGTVAVVSQVPPELLRSLATISGHDAVERGFTERLVRFTPFSNRALVCAAALALLLQCPVAVLLRRRRGAISAAGWSSSAAVMAGLMTVGKLGVGDIFIDAEFDATSGLIQHGVLPVLAAVSLPIGIAAAAIALLGRSRLRTTAVCAIALTAGAACLPVVPGARHGAAALLGADAISPYSRPQALSSELASESSPGP